MNKEKQYLLAKLMRGIGGMNSEGGSSSPLDGILGTAEEELKRRMEEEERKKLANIIGGNQ